MFYKKKGMPEVNEVVMCNVKKVLFHSVFVDIEDYGLEGMIHISEVSPGRIRNIRDYVKEGKKIVCKVLNIKRDKGHIDLSLRRVNLAQRKNKVSEYKQEQKSEKILEHVARDLKTDLKGVYDQAGYKILEKYDTLHSAFVDIAENDMNLEKLGIDKKVANIIEELVKERIKPAIISIKGTLKLSSFDGNGVELIKKILSNLTKNKLEVIYLGSGKYGVGLQDKNYKDAEVKLKDALDSSSKLAKELSVNFDFSRKNA
jgi:translation initiation factor 2 subunit 1